MISTEVPTELTEDPTELPTELPEDPTELFAPTEVPGGPAETPTRSRLRSPTSTQARAIMRLLMCVPVCVVALWVRRRVFVRACARYVSRCCIAV